MIAFELVGTCLAPATAPLAAKQRPCAVRGGRRLPVLTVAHRGAFLSAATLAAFAAAALLVSACGSSSETETLTGPSSGKCALQLTAEGVPFPAGGGSGSLRVAANRECPWTAKTDAAWLTIAQPAEGQGDGSIRFSAAENGDGATRTAAISVNDQRFDISQVGKPCEFVVSSNHESIDAAGGQLSVNVRASGTQCAWTASSGVSWISIVSGRDGRGSGTVTFQVAAVTGPPRSGNVTIAGQNVQVDQGTGCSFTIGADAFGVLPAGPAPRPAGFAASTPVRSVPARCAPGTAVATTIAVTAITKSPNRRMTRFTFSGSCKPLRRRRQPSRTPRACRTADRSLSSA